VSVVYEQVSLQKVLQVAGEGVVNVPAPDDLAPPLSVMVRCALLLIRVLLCLRCESYKHNR
jgi:hypothetical protein